VPAGSDGVSTESDEFNRLFAKFTADRLIFGPTSDLANRSFLELVRYAEANGEAIWGFTEMVERISKRPVK
jgi:hypothetical protein